MPELQTTLQWVAPWLERAASGMANDPGIISFSKAFERAQEQKSPFYQLQVQQLQSQIATMGYQMQRQKLGLEMDQAAKADILEGKRSASEMATEMSKVKNWTDPGALAALDAIYAKRPTKEGKAMLDEAAVRHKEAVAAQDRSEQNRLRAEATAARMETEIYKVGAKAEVDLEKQRSAAELAQAKLEAERSKLSPQAAERQDFAKLTEQKSNLEALIKSNPTDSGLRRLLRETNTKIQAWEVQHGATEETIEATPGGGVSIRRGKAAPTTSPDVLTTQNLSKAQQSLDASLTSIEAGKRLMPLISSETVGPRAFAESWIKDRFLANLYPELASEKRVTAERFAAEMRASAIRDLRSDGNISEKERLEITRAVPEINDPIDSPERARDLIKASLRSNGMRAIMTARRMKVPIPSPAVKALEDTDILQLVDSRLITADEAKAFWKMKRQP